MAESVYDRNDCHGHPEEVRIAVGRETRCQLGTKGPCLPRHVGLEVGIGVGCCSCC